MKPSRLLATVSAVVLVAAAGVSAATLRQGPTPPSEMHRWLQSHVGMWDAKISVMGSESKGTWEVRPGPGGLWILSEFKGEVMGAPFHGMEFMGFEPDSKEFVSYWIDSQGSKATVMTGTYDKATKTLTSKGAMPGMDGTMTEATNITRYPDADHMNFEMQVAGPDGSPMSMMTIEYTRRK